MVHQHGTKGLHSRYLYNILYVSRLEEIFEGNIEHCYLRDMCTYVIDVPRTATWTRTVYKHIHACTLKGRVHYRQTHVCTRDTRAEIRLIKHIIYKRVILIIVIFEVSLEY